MSESSANSRWLIVGHILDMHNPMSLPSDSAFQVKMESFRRKCGGGANALLKTKLPQMKSQEFSMRSLAPTAAFCGKRC